MGNDCRLPIADCRLPAGTTCAGATASTRPTHWRRAQEKALRTRFEGGVSTIHHICTSCKRFKGFLSTRKPTLAFHAYGQEKIAIDVMTGKKYCAQKNTRKKHAKVGGAPGHSQVEADRSVRAAEVHHEKVRACPRTRGLYFSKIYFQK